MGFDVDTPVVAGTVLVRSAIQSPDYVAGVSGWAIFQDGTAEFNSITVRGELFVTGDDGSQISIRKLNFAGSLQPFLSLLPGDPAGFGGYDSATLNAREVIPGDAGRVVQLVIDGPRWNFPGSKTPSIRLISDNFTATTPQHIDMFGRVFVKDMAGSNGDVYVQAQLNVGNPINQPFYKVNITAAGVLSFGDGTVAGDTNLYRSAANVLKTDDAFVAAGGVNNGFVYQQTIIYTAGASFTKASFPNAAMARIRAVGAGGGGGGVAANAAGANSCAGGGGGGAYAESWVALASMGASETVTVGAAGTAGAVGGAGGAGGVSSFGSLVSANGGNGGNGGGTAATFFINAGGVAQSTATGQLTVPGASGSWGIRNSGSYVVGQQGGGNGGYTPLGAGGQGTNNAAGQAGLGYGGGGGGSSAPQSAGGFVGGAGAPGVVIVELYG